MNDEVNTEKIIISIKNHDNHTISDSNSDVIADNDYINVLISSEYYTTEQEKYYNDHFHNDQIHMKCADEDESNDDDDAIDELSLMSVIGNKLYDKMYTKGISNVSKYERNLAIARLDAFFRFGAFDHPSNKPFTVDDVSDQVAKQLSAFRQKYLKAFRVLFKFLSFE